MPGSNGLRPRRIITGIDSEGKSYVARDEVVEQVDYSFGFKDLEAMGEERVVDLWRMWAYDSSPITLPTDGLIPPVQEESMVNGHIVNRPASPDETPEMLRRISAQPHGPGGIRVGIDHFRQTRPSDIDEGGQNRHLKIHWHPTIDIRFIIDGELTLILDSGDRVTARKGDCLISHSDSHRWHIENPEGCTFGIVMIGGEPVGDMPTTPLNNHVEIDAR
jgi:hypothetical protein